MAGEVQFVTREPNERALDRGKLRRAHFRSKYQDNHLFLRTIDSVSSASNPFVVRFVDNRGPVTNLLPPKLYSTHPSAEVFS